MSNAMPDPAPARAPDATAVAFDTLPGHLIRRLQQIAVGLFIDEVGAEVLTPVQFAALAAVERAPGLDQRSLARAIGLDTSTTGGIVDRLERRGLLARTASPTDRRARLVGITDAGAALLVEVAPRVRAAQERILAPLPASQRAEFMRALERLVVANNDYSRAPGD